MSQNIILFLNIFQYQFIYFTTNNIVFSKFSWTATNKFVYNRVCSTLCGDGDPINNVNMSFELVCCCALSLMPRLLSKYIFI